jgi:cyclophilin family peptidyl-prolyl cis-trans isomerase
MNKEYTLFGKVIQGMDIVQKIKRGDVIKEIKVVE